MSDKWEQSVTVPGCKRDRNGLEETQRLIGHGVRAVFSHGLRARGRSLPVTYLQSHRGFPRECPELYCTASIRLMDRCLDLCSESLSVVGDYVSAVEFACPRGHRLLASRSQHGTFLSSRLTLSFSLVAEWL